MNDLTIDNLIPRNTRTRSNGSSNSGISFNELNNSDWRFMSDQNPSEEWINYRTFLRDLPENFDDAWSAGDAWNQYDIPE